jgi:MFS family permease
LWRERAEVDPANLRRIKLTKITKASYAVLIACTITHFLNHIYTGALSPFLYQIQIDLTFSYTEIGLVASAAVITMTLAHLAIGYYGDKGWRDIFIPASVLVSAVAILLTGFVTTFLMLVLVQVLLGLGASGYHPSAFPALSEKFPASARAKSTGMQAMGGLVGMAVIPIAGASMMAMLGGWQLPLMLIGAFGIALFIPTVLLMMYSRRPEFDVGEGLEETGGADGWTRSYAISVVVMGLRGMAFRCTTLLMPFYLAITYGYEPVRAGLLTTVMLIAGLVGEMVSAPLSDRIGRRVPFIIASTLCTTPCLLLLNFSLDNIALIIVLIGIGFFYFLGVPPNTAYLIEVSPKHAQGLAFGLLFSVGAIPGALSPIIFGVIGDSYGLSASILFLVVTTTLATLVSFMLKEGTDTTIIPEALVNP